MQSMIVDMYKYIQDLFIYVTMVRSKYTWRGMRVYFHAFFLISRTKEYSMAFKIQVVVNTVCKWYQFYQGRLQINQKITVIFALLSWPTCINQNKNIL